MECGAAPRDGAANKQRIIIMTTNRHARATPARHGPYASATATPPSRTGLSPAEIRQIILEILG